MSNRRKNLPLPHGRGSVAAFEHYPPGVPRDDAEVNLRAYVSSLEEGKLSEYDPAWSDEELRVWDGNFRSDGALMLVCCQRDVDVREYRQVLELYREFLGAG